MEKKLRVGVIGVGYLGKFHAEKYAQMDDVQLTAVADTDKANADAVASAWGARAYTRHLDMMPEVDAVSIVVPTVDHHAIAREFLAHDKDVLIEKPMTCSLDEADDLNRFAESRGLIIQVGHLERYNPAVLALKDVVKKPRFIESHRLGVFKNRGTDVSVVLDLMIHDIDIISSLVQSEVKKVHAAGTPIISSNVDIANARLEFENGCVANVTASRISMKNQRKIRIFQQDAYLAVDFAKSEIMVVRRDPDSEGEGLIPGMQVESRCFTKSDALDDELHAFIRAVRERRTPEVNGHVGRNALDIALKIMDQINTAIHREPR